MICYKCNKEKRTFNSFGKEICNECLEKRKTGKKGHSGMIYKKDVDKNTIFSQELKLIRVKKSHPLFVKWYFEHYPKSKGIVGRQLNYLIYYEGKPKGIITASSPPKNYKKFKIYFNGIDEKLFVNNSVFRIVDNPIKNFCTQVLKLFRNKIKIDYKKIYGDELIGIVTFVEKPRTGSIYKADNWDCIGETQGVSVRRKGENWQQKQYIKGVNKKHIFALKL